MSAWLIALVGLIYAYIAVERMYIGDVPTSIIFCGYAFSNIGLYLLAR